MSFIFYDYSRILVVLSVPSYMDNFKSIISVYIKKQTSNKCLKSIQSHIEKVPSAYPHTYTQTPNSGM